MSILKSLQNFLEGYGKMGLVVLTDQTTEQPSSYAIAPSGNSKITEDILGNRSYQNSYIFYAKELAASEVDRQDTYDFLEDFSDWLEEQSDTGNLPSLPGNYQAESLEVSNAMLFDIEENGCGVYQIQLQFIFTKRRG